MQQLGFKNLQCSASLRSLEINLLNHATRSAAADLKIKVMWINA